MMGEYTSKTLSTFLGSLESILCLSQLPQVFNVKKKLDVYAVCSFLRVPTEMEQQIAYDIWSY